MQGISDHIRSFPDTRLRKPSSDTMPTFCHVTQPTRMKATLFGLGTPAANHRSVFGDLEIHELKRPSQNRRDPECPRE